MGLFSNIFNTVDSENKIQINWVPLSESSQLDTLIKLSKTKPVLIFKHSTRCGISRMALKSFEKQYDLSADQIELYFLDLLNYRGLSDEIATRFHISHQSPQVIVLQNEKVVYHDSHYQISVEEIKKVISLQPIVS
ncbi:MAG: bacillithiol system redox-active protein YtxJ [Bacteroidetes bacterium]|nr:bacillithiol system redox-active protein YtxJ [Bacteroidota bacterium]